MFDDPRVFRDCEIVWEFARTIFQFIFSGGNLKGPFQGKWPQLRNGTPMNPRNCSRRAVEQFKL